MRKKVLRIAPWLVTSAVVAAILLHYPLERIYDALRRGNAGAVIPFALLLPLSHLAVQAIWDRWIINASASANLSYYDVVRGRGASAVLLALGFALSAGGYGVWIGRRAGCDARTTIGIVLYIALSTLVAICLVAGAAVWLGGAALTAGNSAALGVSPRAVGIVAPVVAAGLLAIAFVGPRLLAGGEKSPRLLAAVANVSAALLAVNMLGRIIDVTLIVAYTWLAALAFGLEIPPEIVAAYLPIILLVGSLPINIAGLGAVQAAWLVFEPWAPGEELLAFQFLWHMSTGIAIALRGAPFVRRVWREIASDDEEPVTVAEN